MRKIRLPGRLLVLCLAAVLLLSGGVSAAFSDTSGHWAENAIRKWSEEYSIIRGYEDGTFRPDTSITRGAFAVILDRFLKYQTASPTGTFSDTPGTWCESSILKLNAAGVMLGDGGKAKLWNDISRQEAVVMIARAFSVPESQSAPTYDDAGKISDYAKGYVAAMTERGYITDTKNNCFRPREAITRAEIVNILNNMIEVLLQEGLVYSKDVQGTMMINAVEGASLVDMTITGDLIIAPGVCEMVTLTDVEVQGSVRNFSQITPTVINTVDEKPEDPKEEQTVTGIQPSEVYTPSRTTGEYITYSGKQIPVYAGAEPIALYDGDFAWEEDRLVYLGDAFGTRFGIDVSAYQNQASPDRTIDWEAVREDGVEFVFVRAGFRGYGSGTLNKDVFLEKNVTGAMEAGLETGVYFFAQAITVEEAIEEADYVIELLKDLEIDGPVAYDWEMHDSTYRVYGTPPEMATACAVAFCKRIEEAGYQAMVYAGQYVSYIKYDQGALADYLSWYPEYKTATSEKLYPTYYYQMDYWQFSSNCAIDGIGGRVDANLQFIR